jgi:hypothetical protein
MIAPASMLAVGTARMSGRCSRKEPELIEASLFVVLDHAFENSTGGAIAAPSFIVSASVERHPHCSCCQRCERIMHFEQ